MNDMRATVVESVEAVAPELDGAEIRDTDRLQEDLDLDSIDFLDVVAELEDRTGVSIPETDYPELATVAGCVDYLKARTAPTS